MLAESEQQAGFADLRRLFDARSIAVVGASADWTKIGGRPLALLRRHGYEGRLYAVNPKYERIDDVPCFRTVTEIDDEIDLAIITVPADKVIEVVDECGRAGVRFAVIFAAGFAEVDPRGKALQQTLVDTARVHGIRLLGPNTIGFVSAPGRVLATFAPTLGTSSELADGDVALISQSGAMSLWSYHWAREQGIALRHYAALGNEADLDFADLTMHVASDPGVKAVGGHVEGLKDGRKFMAAARAARALGVPLCVLKVGTSEVGARAAASHTGALAGSDRVYDGIFRQCGVTRATEPQQLIDFLQVVSRLDRLPRSSRIGIVSLSGGVAAWMADQFIERGLEVPEFEPATRSALRRILPHYASIANPVDLTGAAVTDPGLVADSVEAVLADPGIDTVVLLMALQERTGPGIARNLAALAARTSKFLTVAWCFAPADVYRTLESVGVPTFQDFGRCCRAVIGVVSAGLALARGGSDYGRPPQPSTYSGPPPYDVDTEHGAKRLLASLGIATPTGGLARTPSEAGELAAALDGLVVLKVHAPGLAHKTDLGLLELNVRPDDVPDAYARLSERARAGGVDPQAILVEAMADDGLDTIVGTVSDPVFGPVLMLGAGGVLVEATRRVAFRAVPVAARDIEEMVDETGLDALLDGSRGGPPYDRDGLITAALTVGEFVACNAEWLGGLEVNPLRVLPRGQGVLALDALINRNGSVPLERRT